MTIVADLMTADVLTVDQDMTLSQIARVLRTRNVGSAIVTDDGRPVGMISERELVDSIAAGRNPDVGTALTWMRQDVAPAVPEMSVERAAELMRDSNVRHLPVVENERLVGVVSLRDLLVGSQS
jgi:CBS domain-containing protein